MAEYIIVRSVLGDTREAEIRPGDGQPWFNCPFCGTAVYAEAGPAELGAFVGRHGRCQNPWCIANPAMPLEAARKIVQEAQDAADAAARRERDHEAARRRIADYAASQAAGRANVATEAEARGACVTCALEAWTRNGRAKYVRHRGQCPKARQNGPQS